MVHIGNVNASIIVNDSLLTLHMVYTPLVMRAHQISPSFQIMLLNRGAERIISSELFQNEPVILIPSSSCKLLLIGECLFRLT